MSYINASGARKFHSQHLKLSLVMPILGRRISRMLGLAQRLFHRQLAAGAANHLLRGTGIYKLKTVAEGVPLADHGMHFHRAKG